MEQSKISWDNLDEVYENEEDYEALCEKSKPSDFYFAVNKFMDFCAGEDEDARDGYTYIAIVPKVYFNKENCMWDQSMYLDHILPDDFNEAMESIWECERSIEDARKVLIEMGFEENSEVFRQSD